jgi:diguanylate cyclase (GGDEF)-like protein
MGHLSGQLSSLRIKQKVQALALQSAVQDMQQMATHDDLTALPNRRYLTEHLEKALLSFQRHSGNGSVLYIDIDNFQGFNDTHGHTYGDELLQRVAKRLKETLRAEDTLVRFGGDEFVVMLLNLEGDSQEVINQSKMVAEKVLRSFQAPIELSSMHYQCSASIGIAQFGQESISADDVLKRADLALYQAKNGGRNTFRFFDPEIQALVIARTEMEAHMRRGIVQNEFLLHYQPQVDEARTIIGVEALVRWQHPQWGMVSPGNFIPLAEDTGLIMPLGAWVLETACQQIKLWSQDPKSTIQSVSVNVSASQFLDANFVALVLSALGKAEAPASMLKLELTESMLVTDAQTIIKKMGSLREHGIGFSMDDFGTGYSSLTYLRRLPLDQLKIDQSFLKEALTNQKDAAIVRVIIELGTSLEMKVIAEGVETQEQCDLLLRNGCSHFQGYLFGRPVLASGICFD